jgi:hypothetical protein
MSAPLRALVGGLWALAFGCSSAPGVDQGAAGAGGSVASQLSPRAWSPIDGGSAEIPALSDDELRRLLDALEQEIDDP